MKTQKSEKNNIRILTTSPLTIQRLKDLSEDLKITQICRRCGLNYNSLKTKLYKLTNLSSDEADKIGKYLESRGILVSYSEFGTEKNEES